MSYHDVQSQCGKLVKMRVVAIKQKRRRASGARTRPLAIRGELSRCAESCGKLVEDEGGGGTAVAAARIRSV